MLSLDGRNSSENSSTSSALSNGKEKTLTNSNKSVVSLLDTIWTEILGNKDSYQHQVISSPASSHQPLFVEAESSAASSGYIVESMQSADAELSYFVRYAQDVCSALSRHYLVPIKVVLMYM